jgi:large subunit ribosomal protein L3
MDRKPQGVSVAVIFNLFCVILCSFRVSQRICMKYILGTKQGMSRIFDEDGEVHPVTVLAVSPNVVTQVKTVESDGYDAVQIGTGSRREKNISKAVKGHLKGKGPFAALKEFRAEGKHNVGDTIDVSVFAPGDVVDVSAISKGKGFQGVVKRHGFHGGPRSHGQAHSEREPGSISTGRLQTVRKGKKMAGRMGGRRVTVKNLKVLRAEDGQLFIRGAIPGRRGTLVEVREAHIGIRK